MIQLNLRLVSLAAASAALLFAVAEPLQAQSVVANGGGTIDFLGNTRHFSFTVLKRRDGSVHGQAQINVPATGTAIHFRIESFYDTGTDLICVGPVTHAVNGPPVGCYAIFSVRDGGPGGSADTMTFANCFPFAFTAKDIVTTGPPLPVIINVILGGYHPLLGGNITVH